MTRSAALRVQLSGHCPLGLAPPGGCTSGRALQGAEAPRAEPGAPLRARAGGPQGCAWCPGAPVPPAAPWRLLSGRSCEPNEQQALSARVRLQWGALRGPSHTAGKEHLPPCRGQPGPARPTKTTSLGRTMTNRAKPGLPRPRTAVLLGLVPSVAVPTGRHAGWRLHPLTLLAVRDHVLLPLLHHGDVAQGLAESQHRSVTVPALQGRPQLDRTRDMGLMGHGRACLPGAQLVWGPAWHLPTARRARP